MATRCLWQTRMSAHTQYEHAPRQRRQHVNEPFLALRFPAMLLALIAAMLIVLSACGSTTTDPYGGPQNHLHDILALSGVPHTILVASHYGLYRSSDDGQHWTTVAGTTG